MANFHKELQNKAIPSDWVSPLWDFKSLFAAIVSLALCCLRRRTSCVSDWHRTSLPWSLSNTIMGIVSIQTHRVLLEIDQGLWKWFCSNKRTVCFCLMNIWVLFTYKMVTFPMRILQGNTRNPPELCTACLVSPRLVRGLCPHWRWASPSLTCLGHYK